MTLCYYNNIADFRIVLQSIEKKVNFQLFQFMFSFTVL